MINKGILASALLAVSTTAWGGPAEGNWEIVFSNAGGGFATDGDVTSLGAGIRAGKFISGSTHELGFGADFNYFDSPTGSSESLDLAGFYRYNWATEASEEWLYGGVEIELYNLTDSDLSGEAVRPHFGKKWMLSDDVAFDLNGGVVISTDSDVDPTFDARFGLTIFF